ncbi:MAG: SusC/RagA family TonB-linked outer membrane protein [Bacteroidales bacterium]
MATSVIKGTNKGTSCDVNGDFDISVAKGAVLRIVALGYVTKDFVVEKENCVIILQEDAVRLSDVVVTGVATGTPKQKLGFSIEKISEDKLMQVPATDAGSALTGKIAGVHVTKTSGAPGSGSDIQLRGVKSIYGSSNPLVIVDGVLTENGLNDVNAEDIKSIEVLKGAAASSMYGSRAANGVVSIITKRGNEMGAGKVQVDFRTEYGMNYLGYVPEKSTSTHYKVENSSVLYGVSEPDHVSDNKYPKTYDQIKQFFNPGSYLTSHLALKGTSNDNRLSVYTSLQTTDEEGVVKMVDGMTRTNVKMNVDYRITDKLLFTSSNLFSRMKTDNRANSVFGSLFRCDPGANLLADNIDGTPYMVNANKYTDTSNPLYAINNSKNESVSEKLISFFQLKYDPFEDLSFSTSYGTTRSDYESLYMSPKGKLNYDLTVDQGSISRYFSKAIEQAFTADATYRKIFGDFNTLLKLQYLYESSSSSDLNGGGSSLGVSGLDLTSVSLASSQSTSSSKYTSIANNVALMLNADYRDKYILDALVRRDASSLFGSDVRWQTFYRIAGAWRITKDFDIPGINEWKLRASYGVAGLRPPFEAQYEVFALTNGVAGNMETLGNSHLKPSFSKEWEFGTDMHFLDRFDFTINYSIENNEDQILKVPISSLSGAAYQWQNAGTLKTQSLEASLSADILNTKDMNLNLGLTFDKFKQKITKLNCTPYMLNGTRFRIEEGVDFGALYLDTFAKTLDEVANQVPEGRTVDEVFVINNQGFVVRRDQIGTINETPIKIKDDNGNILSLPTENLTPNFNLNLNASFRYRHLSLYMLWSYQNGGNVYDHAIRYTTEPKLFDQSGKPWNEVKAEAYYSNGGQEVGLLGWDNDVLLFDATFLKLREVSLSYDFKIKPISRFVKNIKISIIGRNLLTFTKYPGFDPEGVTGSSSNGVDSNAFRLESNDQYPLYKTVSGSLALTF